MRRSRIALRWRFAFVLGFFDDVGMFWDFGLGGPVRCFAGIVWSSLLAPLIMASMMSGVGVLFEARKRPHYASQAEATPRVDVGEVSQASGDNAARSFKDQNPCAKGGLNKRCFFVIDLSGKTLTSITGIPVEKFYLVVDGRMLNLDLTLSQAGFRWDVSVRMLSTTVRTRW